MIRILISLAFFYAVVASLSPAYATCLAEISERFHTATTIDQRLNIFIDAINEKVIYKGMPVSSIDKIFDTKLELATPRVRGKLTTIPVELLYPGTHWYCSITFDDTGSVQRYQLSDFSYKNAGIPEHLSTTSERSQLGKRFRLSTSDKERVEVCLQAIKSKIIHYRMPISNLTEILGEAWKAEAPLNGNRTYSVTLSKGTVRWRLFFSVKDDLIDQYFLTTM